MAVNAPIIEKASAGVREILSALSSSEARYFDEERYSEAELRKSLNDSLTDRKIDAMKRILAAVSVGRDASALFPDVVKNVSFQSLELKKLIYIYLVQYAENNRDLALLSINSFQKDLLDRSALVRASALRAMASIKVLEVIQLVMASVKTAAHDSSPYVRKTAAQCMTKVYAVDPDQFLELRGLLLKLMNDQEVQVVGGAVMAFRHICVVHPPVPRVDGEEVAPGSLSPEALQKPQIQLLHPHYRRLCQEILLMDYWAQQSCLDLLLRYGRLFFAPSDSTSEASAEGEEKEAPSEDFKLLLKTLKLLLVSGSKGVTLSAAVALCYLAPFKDIPAVTMPLLRCLKQAPPESATSLMVAIVPLIEARPELFRSHIREFFIQSFETESSKEQKLKVLLCLVDETNVQLVLRELQAYVSWHSQPGFVTKAVQTIAKVALKISSVADSCLRGLVKMLDSKCEALACEAVVALRTLLQQRQQSATSGLGSVLPHLVRYLEDLAAPTARASVVWIIGQYQREVPRQAPDVVRKLSKSFAAEPLEVKQQILRLALKVWAFHALNSRGDLPQPEDAAASAEGASEKKVQEVTREESSKILPRIEAVVDHINKLASFDVSWDVRDTARGLGRLKAAAKAALTLGSASQQQSLEALGLWYCQAVVKGQQPVDVSGVDPTALEDVLKASGTAKAAGSAVESSWTLGSMAQALDFPLESYQPLPGWAEESSPDELRRVKVEIAPAPAVKSISSSNVGNVQHMENRIQQPSNITKMAPVTSLEDLDLFYSEATPAPAVSSGPSRVQQHFPKPEVPVATLEQVRLGGPVIPAGTVVFGEDDESDEEQEEEDNDDDWKYCQQAAAPAAAHSSTKPAAAPPAATEAPPPPPSPTSPQEPAVSAAPPPVQPQEPAGSAAPPPVQPQAASDDLLEMSPKTTAPPPPPASATLAQPSAEEDLL